MPDLPPPPIDNQVTWQVAEGETTAVRIPAEQGAIIGLAGVGGVGLGIIGLWQTANVWRSFGFGLGTQIMLVISGVFMAVGVLVPLFVFYERKSAKEVRQAGLGSTSRMYNNMLAAWTVGMLGAAKGVKSGGNPYIQRVNGEVYLSIPEGTPREIADQMQVIASAAMGKPVKLGKVRAEELPASVAEALQNRATASAAPLVEPPAELHDRPRGVPLPSNYAKMASDVEMSAEDEAELEREMRVREVAKHKPTKRTTKRKAAPEQEEIAVPKVAPEDEPLIREQLVNIWVAQGLETFTAKDVGLDKGQFNRLVGTLGVAGLVKVKANSKTGELVATRTKGVDFNQAKQALGLIGEEVA